MVLEKWETEGSASDRAAEKSSLLLGAAGVLVDVVGVVDSNKARRWRSIKFSVWRRQIIASGDSSTVVAGIPTECIVKTTVRCSSFFIKILALGDLRTRIRHSDEQLFAAQIVKIAPKG